MGIIVAYFFISGIYLWILIGVLEYFGIFNKFTMRIISSISFLFVVAGFFMPVFSNQSGFNLTKLLHDIDIYNLKSISITLYAFFIISLLGSLLFIVIINKNLSICFDWIPIIIDIGCFVYLKDLFSFSDLLSFSGDIADKNLQIGGYFIIIGLLHSLISLIIASIFQISENIRGFNKFTMRVMSSISLLFIAIGFFMPIAVNQSGFDLAKLLRDIETYNLNSISISLYILFIISLLGSLLFIPIIMNKKLSIFFDWIPIIVNISCLIYMLIFFNILKKDILFSFSENIVSLNLQIGGCFMIIGFLYSIISIGIASIFQSFESRNAARSS